MLQHIAQHCYHKVGSEASFRMLALLADLQLRLLASPWPLRVKRAVLGCLIWPVGAWWIWRETGCPRWLKLVAWAAAARWLYALLAGRGAGG